ncbi:MAG: hypothetical protein F6K07_33045, partial [Okeania sp. SIO1H5]|uniref:aminopeptidase P N-terminal domain-containing protein n=1 Tax=Okeania sp. SIO1H5 TaxID=2607777 RepID=UPI0013B5EB8E
MAALPYASPDLLQKYSQVFPNGVTDTKHRDTLIARRESMLERLDSFALFSGLEVEPGMENLFLMNPIRIYQEPSVLYLTGLNQVGIRLLLNPHGKVKEMLFVPPKDPKKEFWEGTQFGYEKKNGTDPSKELLTQLTGISAILPDAHFPEVLGKLVRKSKKGFCYCFYHEYPTGKKPVRSKEDHNWKFTKLVRQPAHQLGKLPVVI